MLKVLVRRVLRFREVRRRAMFPKISRRCLNILLVVVHNLFNDALCNA